MEGGTPGKALFTVHGEAAGRPPSSEEAARQLGVPSEAIDASFGVVLIDPAANLYSVQVEASQVPGELRSAAGVNRGPFADPRIEPLGPTGEEKSSPAGSEQREADLEGDG